MPVRDYQSDLLIKLADPEYATLYLKAALEAMLKEGDREVFRLALVDVFDARQPTAENIKKTEQLKRELEQEAQPTLATLISVLTAVGITIDFKVA